MNRGDLVIVDFRHVNPNAGVRPALVIQNDHDNSRIRNTIVTQITTNLRFASESTQVLIDPSHPDWTRSGLLKPSVVNCSNIYTIEQQDIARVVGSLSEATMEEISACLILVLDL